MRVATREQPLSVVVLLSGSGTNLQAILTRIQQKSLPISIKAVISNNPDAFGLTRAEQAGIPNHILSHKDFANREMYDDALRQLIDQYQPELVVLAGFMRILSDAFVEHFAGRMLNIHPSLLPKYQGLNTHQRALDAGDNTHGASVHFVTPELDGGPVILQASVPVLDNDTAESLAQRVHEKEYEIYPTVIEWFALGRLQFNGDQVFLDGQTIEKNQ